MNQELLQVQGADFEEGYRPFRSRQLSPSRIAQFQESLGRVMQGRVHPVIWLKEEQSRSDFPLLMADTIDRTLLAGYLEYPISYPAYARVKTNRDFRAAKLFAVDGAEGVLEPINELGPYPQTAVQETKYEVTVQKYGKMMGFSFELMINDDLSAFQDTPLRFGRAARRNREYRVTVTFASIANQGTLYTNANANKVTITNGARTNNPALSVDGIMSAMEVLSRQVDADGQPINIQGAVVVYPPNLQIVAEQIQNTLQIWTDIRGGTVGTAGSNEYKLEMRNFLANRLTWVMNSQLPLVNATNGRTGWYVFANPNEGRPALVVAELAGHQTPDLLMRASNSVRVGGGLVDPMEGSFENDSMMYKVRDFIGSTTVDPKSTVFSDGTGV